MFLQFLNFRGMGIIPAFIYDTCELVKKEGAKYAITFALASNNNTCKVFLLCRISYLIFLEKKNIFCLEKMYLLTEIPPDFMESFIIRLTRRIPKALTIYNNSLFYFFPC